MVWLKKNLPQNFTMNYTKMTILWSFSYKSFVKLSLYNTIHSNTVHGPQS